MARFLKHYIQRRSTVKGQYYILKSKLKAFKKSSFFIFRCRLEDPTEVAHVWPNGQKLVNFECKKIWFSSHYTLYSRRKIKEWKKIYSMFYLCKKKVSHSGTFGNNFGPLYNRSEFLILFFICIIQLYVHFKIVSYEKFSKLSFWGHFLRKFKARSNHAVLFSPQAYIFYKSQFI